MSVLDGTGTMVRQLACTEGGSSELALPAVPMHSFNDVPCSLPWA